VGGLPEPPATLEPPRRDYEACFDATLENGFLTYAECYLAGETEEEVLISTHACHPSLANDNLSGVVVATFLAKHMVPALRRYSYRSCPSRGRSDQSRGSL
jgi:aminopeptidase-like protein